MGETNKTNNYTEFYYHFFRNILLVSVPLVIISALILGFAIPHSSADNNTSSDSLSISISSACTLSSNIDRAHTVNVNAGTHTVDIGSTRVNAYCNDNNGYSIYAIGSSNNIDGNTDLVSDINDNYNIKTGIYNEESSSSLTPSSWGMKLAPGIGTGLNPETGASIATTPPTIVNNYDNYNVVPSNYTLVASRASGTNMTIDTDITGSYFTTTYDVYASSVQPAGAYNGKVKYALVHPYSNSNTVTFSDTFARAGKEPVIIQGSGVYYKMQDMNTVICNAVTVTDETSQIQLVDIRDNKLYWVAKLQDGHCWMTQNLDFDINANTALNSQTTDLNVAYNSFTGQYTEYNNGYTVNNDTIYWIPASSATTIGFQNTGPITDWANSNTTPYSASKTDDAEAGHASMGNWYNWTAAIASNNSSSLTQDTINDITSNPKNSICPKGWRLPTISNESETLSGSTNEFARLNHLYNNDSTNSITDLTITPLYMNLAGVIESSTTVTTRLVYSSSTVRDSTYTYFLEYYNNSLKTAAYWNKYPGRPIRCIVR